MTPEEKMLLSFIADKAEKCSELNMITYGRFLDMHGRSLASALPVPKGVTRIFYGGTDGPERSMPVFFPGYTEVKSEEDAAEYFREYPEDCPLRILKITKDKFSKPLSHRDYLGALMALGINRDVTGDITVTDTGCFAAVTEGMAAYISENLNKAGRGTLTSEILLPHQVDASAKKEGVPDSFTVSSCRLDSIVRNGFGVSRESAAEAIAHGLVYINDCECLKPDKRVSEGDKITFRHKGRIIIEDCSGLSKKGRIIVKIMRFS